MQALRMFRHLAVTVRCPMSGYELVIGHASTMPDDKVAEYAQGVADSLWDCNVDALCDGESHMVEIVSTDASDG